MAVTFIRAHRRFAVRQTVRITHATGDYAEGLLIELSIRGCRVSNLASVPFESGARVTLEIEGCAPICGFVRCAHDGLLGLTFDAPIYAGMLDNLVCQCRGDTDWAQPITRSAHA